MYFRITYRLVLCVHNPKDLVASQDLGEGTITCKSIVPIACKQFKLYSADTCIHLMCVNVRYRFSC